MNWDREIGAVFHMFLKNGRGMFKINDEPDSPNEAPCFRTAK